VALLHVATVDIDTAVSDNTIRDIGAILDDIDRWEAGSDGNAVTVLLTEIVERTTAE
jgi:hypothetical protein